MEVLYILGILTTIGILGILLEVKRLGKGNMTLEVKLPSELVLAIRTQTEPSRAEVIPPSEEPIPEKILDYIDVESEEHARSARRKRVKELRNESGSWDVAFRMLQKEDEI